jgi:hypothetical protein
MNTPLYLDLGFAAITLITIVLFYIATGKDRKTLFILILWLTAQAALGLAGFYLKVTIVPIRMALLLGPPGLTILVLFATASGRAYLDRFHLKRLTILHSIRAGIELCLLGLYSYHYIPRLMTFEGANFDILSGLSAPLVWYFAFRRARVNTAILWAWNIVCLLLLVNIVTVALLSVPTPMQHLAFDQPNVAVLYFPYIWLPACVVPLVLLSHFAAIRQLALKKKYTKVIHHESLALGG